MKAIVLAAGEEKRTLPLTGLNDQTNDTCY